MRERIRRKKTYVFNLRITITLSTRILILYYYTIEAIAFLIISVYYNINILLV